MKTRIFAKSWPWIWRWAIALLFIWAWFFINDQLQEYMDPERHQLRWWVIPFYISSLIAFGAIIGMIINYVDGFEADGSDQNSP